MERKQYDILIIGGGINGCGIARDATGRGYSVCLAEMNDLASGTSSWSTKLIHGGLRYLEYYEFRLVREALKEREILWQMAPHIVRPLRFVLPHHSGLRPAWLIRLGLFLYDVLGGRKKLARSRRLNLTRHETGKPLKPDFRQGFDYADCWVDDARLVVLNAVDAVESGADIRVRTKVTGARRTGDIWQVELTDQRTGTTEEVEARLLVNAAGPWVDHVLSTMREGDDATTPPQQVRMVQGSHIVVGKLFDHDACYIFQNADNRIIFAIPYEDEFTLIGTTDVDYEGDPAHVTISKQEIDYLCDAASGYFKNPVTPDQIVWTYSGVRPLYDDGATEAQAATRDYVLKTDPEGGGLASIIHIFGGKITTYRKLAEAVLDQIETHIGTKEKAWTRGATLPGGAFKTDEVDHLINDLQAAYPYLTQQGARRLIRAYGTRAFKFSKPEGEQGTDYSGALHLGFYEAEICYLMEDEFALTADDILWRRSKLGLRLSQTDRERLETYIASRTVHGA